MAQINVNGKIVDVVADGATPLLWVLREELGLTGPKYGCGIGQCGACTVHINGAAARSCMLALASVEPLDNIVTIEGLSADSSHPVQKAWAELDVPQCGYCQSGMIMAAALLARAPNPPMPTSMPGLRIYAGAAPTGASARAFTLRQATRFEVTPMTALRISRRGFVAGATAGAFTYGFRIPFTANAAGEMPDEVNAWVVVKLDDTVVIRIARSEMGQGSLTGLAQLVAEELRCDWSKVTTEYPTPATNLKRNLVWKSFTTVASRGIRESADYVRQGGAAAREMLIAAAAKEWGVLPEECTAENSVITCKRLGRSTTFGKVAAAAASIEPPKDI